jgi:hypothetical protein
LNPNLSSTAMIPTTKMTMRTAWRSSGSNVRNREPNPARLGPLHPDQWLAASFRR